MNQQEKWNRVAEKAQTLCSDLERIKSELMLQTRKVDSMISIATNIAVFCDHESKPEKE